MREIKFRIWDGGEFYYSSCYDLLDGYPSEHKCFTEDLLFQQDTGLKDKNGVAIFEGDLIIIDKGKPYESYYEVVYEDGGFTLIHAKRHGDEYGVYKTNLCQIIRMGRGHVIGNVFENKELLN